MGFLGKYINVLFSVEHGRVGNCKRVSARFGRVMFLHVFGTICIFTGIELKHVARPVESDLPISIVSVCLSVRPDTPIDTCWVLIKR